MRSLHDEHDEPLTSLWWVEHHPRFTEENGIRTALLERHTSRVDAPIRQPQRDDAQQQQQQQQYNEDDFVSLESLRDELERWKQSLLLESSPDDAIHTTAPGSNSNSNNNSHNNKAITSPVEAAESTFTATSTSIRRTRSPAKYRREQEDDTTGQQSHSEALSSLHNYGLDTDDEDDSNDGKKEDSGRRWDMSSNEDEEEEDDHVAVAIEPTLDPRTHTRRRRRETTNLDYNDSNNYRTPDTSFILNSTTTSRRNSKQQPQASTPGPPPPVETPARPASTPRSGLRCYHHAGEEERNGTNAGFNRRRSHPSEQELEQNEANVRSTSAAAVREAAPMESRHEYVDDDEDNGWQQRILATALHQQENYIQALELENEQLRANLQVQQQSRRRQGRRQRSYDVPPPEEDDIAATTTTTPWLTSRGTRFVAELATVMDLPEEYYGPLSRIMDKYYNGNRPTRMAQEEHYPPHPWWRR